MPQLDPPLTPLCELARKYGTDKGGQHDTRGTCHNYTPAYHELVKDRREQIRHVLEIGVEHGRSLRMWTDYFPNAEIVGLDIDARCLFSEGRMHVYRADQGQAQSLDNAIAMAGNPTFDLIVDDGSHIPEHQINTANHLKSYLASDGIYAIEDIFFDCQPWTILDQISWGTWTAIPVGIGLGGAHCECGCNGGEVLLVGKH